MWSSIFLSVYHSVFGSKYYSFYYDDSSAFVCESMLQLFSANCMVPTLTKYPSNRRLLGRLLGQLRVDEMDARI